jgi:hypothetical protein
LPYQPPGVRQASPFASAPDGRLIFRYGAAGTDAGDRPTVANIDRIARPPGVSWLPDRLAVNAEPLVLHLASEWPPERVAREGVPTAELFVIGDVHRTHPGEVAGLGHVLRLRVAVGGAVAMSSVITHAPPDVRQRLTGTGNFLLPAGWLDRARLEGGFRLAGTPLLLRSALAGHGADGVPEDVARWPHPGATADVFVVLPEFRDGTAPDMLPLHPRLPATPRSGSRAVRVRLGGTVDPGPAIDVAAGAEALAPLTSVRSRLAELRADGVRLALPRACYDRVTATALFDLDEDGWRERDCPAGLPLAAVLDSGAARNRAA